MTVLRIPLGDPDYPPSLTKYLGQSRPEAVSAIGNLEILSSRLLALFCSARCPGDLILKTYDLARSLRDAGVPVIGGFHSPMEKECLALLLRGSQPVVLCPARSVDGMRLRAEWPPPLTEGRLLILSAFAKKHRRVTADLAITRNQFVAALADTIFLAHGALGSKTELFCRRLLSWGKPVLTLESSENASLIALGAKPVGAESINGNLLDWR